VDNDDKLETFVLTLFCNITKAESIDVILFVFAIVDASTVSNFTFVWSNIV
jgi:hypothetical protein